MNDNSIIIYGMYQIIDELSKSNELDDYSSYINILLEHYKKLDIKSEGYIEISRSVAELIDKMKNCKNEYNKKTIINKCFAIQNLLDLSGLINKN